MRNRILLIAAVMAALAAIAPAGPITQIVAFGDSLSDNGRALAAIGYPPAPYWNGRQSNGLVAVEYMAQRLGVPLTDLAWNGATTGAGNVDDGGTAKVRVLLPGMLAAMNQDLADGKLPIDPNAFYVIWGGPNDFLSITSPADVAPTIVTAVTNLVTMAGTLEALGAQNIMVLGMPDLALTPRIQMADAMMPGTALLMHAAAMNFNAALAASLPGGVRFFDTNAVYTDLYTNPTKYGLKNVTGFCFNGTTVCGDPQDFLFFDPSHPTTAAHAAFGKALADAAVPEPAAWSLTAIGFVSLAVAARRRVRG